MHTSILITLPTSIILQKMTFGCTVFYFTAWLVDHNRVVHHLIPGVAFLLDCRLNDSNVSVELYKQKLGEPRFERVYPRNDSFVKQTGQNFTIFDLHSKGQVKFKCRTAGTPVLENEVRIERAQGLKQQ